MKQYKTTLKCVIQIWYSIKDTPAGQYDLCYKTVCNLSLGWKSTTITVCCYEVKICLRNCNQLYRYTNQYYILILSKENVIGACKCKTCHHIANVRVMFGLSVCLFLALVTDSSCTPVCSWVACYLVSLVLQCIYSPVCILGCLFLFVFWLLCLYVKSYFDSWVYCSFLVCW